MDFFNGLFGQDSSKLHEKRETIIVGELTDDNVFEITEETILEQGDGPLTRKTKKVGIADCGHYVGLQSPRELQGVCVKCGASLCYRCAAARCERCHISPLCPKCSRPIDGLSLCRKCKIIILMTAFSALSITKLHRFFKRNIG